MKIINVLPTKNAEIHKINKLYEVRLFEYNQYIESFYCRKKSEVKPQLKKLGYTLTYDYSLVKTVSNEN